MLLLLRVIIFGSLLVLWFLISYIVFDWAEVGAPDSKSTGTIEDTIAALGNYDNFMLMKELSRKYPITQSIVGVVDRLDPLADGTLRIAGWAIDKDDFQTKLSIFIILPRKAILATNTRIKRDDVKTALRLPTESEPMGFDDIFRFRYNCNDKELSYIFIAINEKKRRFSLIRGPKQVNGCDDKGNNK